jgi:phage shock protein PspC (stress-responsive transcriptional regulator)
MNLMERKLYKNTDNKKIAGVCQGVAEYFDIDPTIVRIVWFVFTWLYGIGVMLYILMWILLPEKSEVAEVLSKSDMKDDFYNGDDDDDEE